MTFKKEVIFVRRIIAREDEVIDIGVESEDNVVEVVFPVVESYRETYGEGTFSITCLRPTETTAYEITPTIDGDNVVWRIEEYDVEIEGYGLCRLVYTGDNDSFVAKSNDYRTYIYGDKITI